MTVHSAIERAMDERHLGVTSECLSGSRAKFDSKGLYPFFNPTRVLEFFGI
jgi:hypothetical protein